LLQGDIGHDLTTINLLLGKHKTLETEILGHESTLQVAKETVVVVQVNFSFFYGHDKIMLQLARLPEQYELN
jgi:hypothetical protein